MEIPFILKKIGLSDKAIRVYSALLTGGPSSVRKLAERAGLNRGTAYDALKELQQLGLAGFFLKHKKQFFMAEDPEKLVEAVERQEQSLSHLRRNLTEFMPQLRSLYVRGGAKPTVKYYEGHKGIRLILKDVLSTMSERSDKTYRVYSAIRLRQDLYKEYPNFTKERIARRLSVRVIAIGSGGRDTPLAERRWLVRGDGEGAPTYTVIYGPKVAHISVNEEAAPRSVLIEDQNIAATEQLIFDRIWESLGAETPSLRQRLTARKV